MDRKTFRELVRRLERGAYRNGFNHGSGVRGASLDQEDHHSGWFALLSYADTLPAPGANTDAQPAEVAAHEALWVICHVIDVISTQRRTDDNYILLQNLLSWRERIADYIVPGGAVEAVPSEPQPQQDLKTLLRDWVGNTLEALQQGHWNREDDGAVLFRQFQSLATLLGDTDAASA